MAYRPDLDAAPPGWEEYAPDPLGYPEYYEGIILRRIFAHFIDLLIILFLCVVFDSFFFALHVISLGLLVLPLLFVGVAVTLTYDALQVGSRHSATLGMRALGLGVRNWTGTRPTLPQALLRAIFFWGMSYFTATLFIWLLLGVALFNTQRRCLHDYLSGTVVIRGAKVVVLSPGCGVGR